MFEVGKVIVVKVSFAIQTVDAVVLFVMFGRNQHAVIAQVPPVAAGHFDMEVPALAGAACGHAVLDVRVIGGCIRHLRWFFFHRFELVC